MKKGLKEKRAASLLRELIAEALGTLDDAMLRGLTVTEVDVKRGMYDADVYLDKSIYTPEEQKEILKHLKRAAPIVQSYCLESSGWFKCPKLHFKFDDMLEEQKRIEELFAKIKDEK
ncbi:30S ribosome-binding factor RbfA [Nitratiruptor sp. SB155-2]|uniref:30S ribosome-binding factor RbfA n=1 Tax=Nitratiruptor sp. (strain SB155-2) TaxID=387092 RepID=UPI0001586EF4|nr:30S ribosome-binding factor RbfA [Nitratiruptor sp. SB155-2]BAF69536.1 ribosome-binding factor A [Nitratiruptor sp. SB155-2]